MRKTLIQRDLESERGKMGEMIVIDFRLGGGGRISALIIVLHLTLTN